MRLGAQDGNGGRPPHAAGPSPPSHLPEREGISSRRAFIALSA